jgi:hypothetical protein
MVAMPDEKMVAMPNHAKARGICTLAFVTTFYDKTSCSYGNVKGFYIHISVCIMEQENGILLCNICIPYKT